MATINLGRVKPVFRGAYAGGTAYVVDDIVTYSNETYICILASTGNLPTDTTYWTKLAAKGTDGTDVGTTLTTQGDLLYRDGSGLQRLAIGTAGQVLQVNSGATAPEYGTVSSDWVRIVTAAGDGTAVLDLNSCFSSTYENYIIFANIHTSTTTNVYIRLQDASNSEVTTEYYYVGTQNYRTSSTSGTDVKSGWNQTYWQPQESVGAETDGYGTINLEVARPFVSNRFTNMNIRYTTYDGANFRQVDSYCQNRNASTQAGIRFYVTTGNITSNSSVSVYGIKNS